MLTRLLPSFRTLLLVPWLLGYPCTAFGAPPKPNIVFILADDLGWRDVGCFGSTYHKTPNLDALAKRGMKFTQAYAANPLCSPTRASIMTGQYPARIGITAPVCHVPEVKLKASVRPRGSADQKCLVADSATRLDTNYVTLAETLKAAGYATGHFGKWHLGSEPYSPLQQGFAVDVPHWPGPGPAGSYVAPWKFPEKLNFRGQPGEHIEDRMASEAVKFIHANKDRPFYLNYWAFSVHAPYDAKQSLVERYRAAMDEDVPQHNPLYAAMVHSLDDAVGTLVKAMEAEGLMEKTLIVFFSDNGGVNWQALKKEGKGGPNDLSKPFADIPPTSNAPLRGGKASIYEGGTREPCFVVWPGTVRPDTASEAMIQSMDFYPTLAEIAGATLPAAQKMDGRSFLPVLKGVATVHRDTIFTFFPHNTPASSQVPAVSVRRGDWKLIRFFHDGPKQAHRYELYNLRADLSETKDLAAAEPALVQELDALITQFLEETEAVVPGPNPAYKEDAAKTVKTAAPADPLEGWKARNCEATAKNGVLTMTAKGAAPFLGVGAAIAWWPGATGKAGRIESSPVHMIDVMPTFLDLAKPSTEVSQQLPSSPRLAGESFFALLQGNHWQRKGPLYFQFMDNRAIRTDQWTMVEVDGAGWELFRADRDPLESRNLAQENPEVVADLNARWLQWWCHESGKENYQPETTRGSVHYKPQGDRGSGERYMPSSMPEKLSQRYRVP